MTNQRNVTLAQDWEFLAGSDADLPLNKVKSGNHLGNRVFDLQASVHFHEVELVCVCIKDELYSSSIVVAYSLSGSDGCLSHLGAEFLGDS